MLLSLRRWTITVPGVGAALYFLLGTRGEVFYRGRRFIITSGSSASSTAAALIVSFA
jgi:hypothetical protein